MAETGWHSVGRAREARAALKRARPHNPAHNRLIDAGGDPIQTQLRSPLLGMMDAVKMRRRTWATTYGICEQHGDNNVSKIRFDPDNLPACCRCTAGYGLVKRGVRWARCGAKH